MHAYIMLYVHIMHIYTYAIHTYIHTHTCIDELQLSKRTEAGEGGTEARDGRNWPVLKSDESPAQALPGPRPAPSAEHHGPPSLQTLSNYTVSQHTGCRRTRIPNT